MDITIYPRKLSGTVQAIPSKSQAHRFLICAALADKPTRILCPETNWDMDATAACLNAMGASVQKQDWGYWVFPIVTVPETVQLYCRDSGSTLRFLLPVAGALGIDATFHMEGRLPQRPVSPLWEEIERMGCQLSRPTPSTIRCQGKLNPGAYSISGAVSSQFITGLMLSLPIIGGESSLTITGCIESKPYITMTEEALKKFGIRVTHDPYVLCGNILSPEILEVEGDWSNGAFFLAARALGNNVVVNNLNSESAQGDKAVNEILTMLQEAATVDAADIPDLIPVLALVAACRQGATFTHIRRLRMKESDRVASIVRLIRNLGGNADADDDSLTIFSTKLKGGIVDSCNDHRIAMTAAIAATICQEPVTILGAQCVQKSYPKFWEEYRRLGGHYEQYLR